MELEWIKAAKNADFQPTSRYISETIEDRHIVSYNGKLIESRIRLWIGTNFDDLE